MDLGHESVSELIRIAPKKEKKCKKMTCFYKLNVLT
jgi:hypothetical protein